MKDKFEEYISRLSPTLRKITYKLNGHFSFFDEDDLYQEALEHLWKAYRDGSLNDKTDSYVLQGCYFHLKNYLRKALDRAPLMSLDHLLDDNGPSIERYLARGGRGDLERIDEASIIASARTGGLNKRELKVITGYMEGKTIREIGRSLGVSHVMVLKITGSIRKKYPALGDRSKYGYQN